MTAIDLTGACLALAALERPWQSLDREIDHLARLAEDLRAAAPAAGLPLEARAGAIAGVLHGRHDYRGDRETYDDLRNANLLAVIERRRGLPIALSVLWLHLAHAMDLAGRRRQFPRPFPGPPGRRAGAADGRPVRRRRDGRDRQPARPAQAGRGRRRRTEAAPLCAGLEARHPPAPAEQHQAAADPGPAGWTMRARRSSGCCSTRRTGRRCGTRWAC